MALVSVNADDLAKVVALACLTEDREGAEQRALLNVAHRLDVVRDREALRKAVSDGELRIIDGYWFGPEGAELPPASRYELIAHTTRVLVDEQRPVKTSWDRKKRPMKVTADR